MRRTERSGPEESMVQNTEILAVPYRFQRPVNKKYVQKCFKDAKNDHLFNRL